jgi:hypothetical protein
MHHRALKRNKFRAPKIFAACDQILLQDSPVLVRLINVLARTSRIYIIEAFRVTNSC